MTENLRSDFERVTLLGDVGKLTEREFNVTAMKTDPKIPEFVKDNFMSFLRAHEAEKVCLVRAKKIATGEYHTLIACMFYDSKTDEYNIVPVAEMIEYASPFDLYDDPTSDNQ